MIEIAALHEVVYDASGRATDYRILDCNAAFTRILGIARETARGSLGSLLYGTTPAPYLDVYARVVETGTHELFETYFPPLDKHFQISVVPMEGRQFATLATDITDRKRSEEALRRSEEGLRAAQGVSHVGSWTWHVQTGRLEWSEEMYRIFGIDRATFSGDLAEVVARAIHPDDQAAVTLSNQGVLQDGRPTPLEYRICHPDGSVRTVWAEAGALQRDQTGRPALLTGIVLDITERKRVEAALREAQSILQAALDQSSAGIAIADAPSGRLRYVNDAGLLIRGEDREAVVNGLGLDQYVASWKLFDLDGTPLRPEAVPLARAILYGEKNSREFIVRRSPGDDRIVLAKAAPVTDAKGQVTAGVVVFLDITEARRSEQERATLEAQLQHSQKMESVGRLAGGIAHDFNNMLGVILGHAEMALQYVDPAQPLHEGLEEIQQAARRSADLTRQLLAFARKQPISPARLDLNATVTGMLRLLQRMLGEDVRLVLKPGADLWPIKMDPSQIDQILANLCVNARDAITEVGTLTIETGNVSCDEATCAGRPDARPGEYVRLAVSDDGCGMDEETRARIFEPFFTTKALGKGTGLGLATLYGIVTQNAGFIDVDSEPGSGTTFTIYLPRHLGPDHAARMPTPSPTASRGHETILLVEDEPAILRVAKRMLERQGYLVLAASTPGEAIRLAAERTGQLHLLVTDLVMPEMNGRDLAKRLLAGHPSLKLLFMSGYSADVVAHQGVLAEGMHFLQKPFLAEELAAAVRATLAG
jgi:PAS domain S-box-containing protein